MPATHALLSPGYATEWLVISPNSGSWPMAVGSFHDLYGRSQTSEGSCFILSILWVHVLCMLKDVAFAVALDSDTDSD